MQKNKIAGWLGGITLAVSLVACGDKTVVTESSVIEEEVAEKEVAEENAEETEMTEKPEGEAPEECRRNRKEKHRMNAAETGRRSTARNAAETGRKSTARMPGEAPPGASDMPGGANGAPGKCREQVAVRKVLPSKRRA